MFGAALIVLRESLEAALLIGIGAGLLGSLVVAGLTEHIAQWADGTGQELFNAGVLGVAVLMLGWHNIWMASHAAEMVQNAKGVAHSVRQGERDLSAIAVLIAMAVLREGSETVLFLYSLATSTPDTSSIALGGILGLAGGIGAGLAMYFGLLRIPLRWFFGVTAGLILLVAAGMAGQVARFLIQADYLPPLQSPLWDTSSLLPMDSAAGGVLHMLIGYEAEPTGMQFIFYATTLAVILGGMWLARRPAAVPAPQAS
jgi:high-affinity iron transporter